MARKKRASVPNAHDVQPRTPGNVQPRKPREFQHQVLDDILDGVNYVSELLTLPPYAGPRHYFEARMAQKDWEATYGDEIKKRRALRDLRKKKWLTDRCVGSEIVVKIHADAAVAALKKRIRSTQKKLADGWVCLIGFDFPVGANEARNRWRSMMKSFEFEMVQLSLYSTDLDVFRQVRALVKALGAERWVKVYRAKEVDGTEEEEEDREGQRRR